MAQKFAGRVLVSMDSRFKGHPVSIALILPTMFKGGKYLSLRYRVCDPLYLVQHYSLGSATLVQWNNEPCLMILASVSFAPVSPNNIR